MPKQMTFECPHCSRHVRFHEEQEEAECPFCKAVVKFNIHERQKFKPTKTYATEIAIVLALGAMATVAIVKVFGTTVTGKFKAAYGDAVQNQVKFE